MLQILKLVCYVRMHQENKVAGREDCRPHQPYEGTETPQLMRKYYNDRCTQGKTRRA
jgi:hypothetical protein